jgi:hypothetical protein
MIGLGTDPDDHVASDIGWEQSDSRQLSQASLDTIPRYRRLLIPRDDEPDACSGSSRKYERGSDHPNLEQRGSDTLPLLRDTL